MLPRDVVIFVVGLLIVNIVWFSLHPAFTALQDYASSSESGISGVQDAQTAIANLRTTFDWMIPLFSIVLIVWLFLTTQRREPDWYEG